jgi:Domain of unknown function (DUF4168)
MRPKTFPKVYIFDRSAPYHPQNWGRLIGQRQLRKAMALLLLALLWWSPMDLAIADSNFDASASNPAPEFIESSPQTSIALDANTISSEKISQFVRAYWQVLALLGRREAQLHAAETAAESQRLEQEIAAAAISIIENSGLTQAEYLQLLALANTDFEFGERVATHLQEEMD